MKEAYQKYYEIYLQRFSHLRAEEIDFIRPHLSIQEIAKGDFFLKDGEVQTQMGYVCFGLLRRYFINDKGSEITTGFVKENEYATDNASLPCRIHLTSRWMKAISKRESTTFLP